MARPAGAALTALALGGMIAGGALAISPTVETTRVFRGGVTIAIFDAPPVEETFAFTVPAGRKFMLTDLAISNNSDVSPAAGQMVFEGSDATCQALVGAFRMSELKVPAGGTLHVPFVTGIGFTAGQHVCIVNGDTADQTNWTIRGYLFD